MPKNIQQPSLLTLSEGKTCKQCDEWKPLVKFLKGGYIGGRSPRCRTCVDPPENARARDRVRYRQPHRNKQVRDKVLKWKANNAGHVRQWHQAHHQANKESHNARSRQAYLENKERRSLDAKAYRESHKEEIAASRAIYRNNNADSIREAQRRSYQIHKESRLAKSKAYRKAHPEVKQICEARRYARKKGSRGFFGVRVWRQILIAYGPMCLKCKEQKPLTVDHVVPVSKGGPDCVCNIQPLCLSCNNGFASEVGIGGDI